MSLFNQASNSIKFKLKNEEGMELNFEATGIGSEHFTALINNIIAPSINPKASIESKFTPVTLTPEPPAVKFPDKVIAETKPEKVTPLAELKSVPAVSRSRQTDFVKHEDREKVYSTEDTKESLFTPEEIAKLNEAVGVIDLSEKASESTEKLFEKVKPLTEAEREPDFYKTGIKYKGPNNDRPMYKTSYQCPNCNHSGRHYIPDFGKVVDCHNCHSKLRVEPATENGFGRSDDFRDKHGNFFIAHTLVIDSTPKYEKSVM